MHNLRRRLEKRGWTAKEIDKAVRIINDAKREKTKDARFLEKRIYWMLLAIITIANFAIAVSLMPILVALNGVFLYVVIVTMGGIFGMLFELVIRGIEHLQKKHHALLAFLVPIIALCNIWIIFNISNDIGLMLGLRNVHNIVLVSIVYAASFTLPYIVYRFILKIGYYAKE